MRVREGTAPLRHGPVARPALTSQIWDTPRYVPSQPSAVLSTHSLYWTLFSTSLQALGGQVTAATFRDKEADAGHAMHQVALFS